MRWGKYGAIRQGGKDSKLESSVGEILQLREKAGELRIIAEQQHIHYYISEVKICEYWPDFTCMELSSREIFWVEAKGFETDVWRLKLSLWRAGGPGRLELWKGSYKNPKLTEIVVPKVRLSTVRQDQVYAKLG